MKSITFNYFWTKSKERRGKANGILSENPVLCVIEIENSRFYDYIQEYPDYRFTGYVMHKKTLNEIRLCVVFKYNYEKYWTYNWMNVWKSKFRLSMIIMKQMLFLNHTEHKRDPHSMLIVINYSKITYPFFVCKEIAFSNITHLHIVLRLQKNMYSILRQFMWNIKILPQQWMRENANKNSVVTA